MALITELAVYEKEPDAVKATPELVSFVSSAAIAPTCSSIHSSGFPELHLQLKKNIFEQGFANCILAKDGTEENPGETVGMALVRILPAPGRQRIMNLKWRLYRPVLLQLFNMARQARSLRE